MKVCEKHPNSPRVDRGCRDCKRENAKQWNADHREHCHVMNRAYYKTNKIKIASRKQKKYAVDPSPAKTSARKSLLKNKYGLSFEDYGKMLEAQNGVCAICLKPEMSRSNPKCDRPDSLRVDHCHATGKIRGLLCSECNFGISKFDDDVEIMKRSIRYLKK